MELILWRHAEAADSEPDLARPLTLKGQQQAHQMAQWLKAQFSGPVRILASPALRARQTADALALPYKIDARIDPDASVDNLLVASGWPAGHGLVILVGHNQAISVLAARLAGADISEDEAAVVMSRGAAWWFVDTADGAGCHLKTAMKPSLLPVS